MKEIQEKIIDEEIPAEDTKVGTEEKALIVLPVKIKKNEDETISTHRKYISRFHYTTRNLDKYMEFCPHCKKPTMTTFQRTVIDNAIDYLEGRRVLKHFPKNKSKVLKFTTGLVAAGAAVYFLLLPWFFNGNV